MGPKLIRKKAEKVIGGIGKQVRKEARKGIKLKDNVVNKGTETKYRRAVINFFSFMTALKLA